MRKYEVHSANNPVQFCKTILDIIKFIGLTEKHLIEIIKKIDLNLFNHIAVVVLQFSHHYPIMAAYKLEDQF